MLMSCSVHRRSSHIQRSQCKDIENSRNFTNICHPQKKKDAKFSKYLSNPKASNKPFLILTPKRSAKPFDTKDLETKGIYSIKDKAALYIE